MPFSSHELGPVEGEIESGFSLNNSNTDFQLELDICDIFNNLSLTDNLNSSNMYQIPVIDTKLLQIVSQF